MSEGTQSYVQSPRERLVSDFRDGKLNHLTNAEKADLYLARCKQELEELMSAAVRL